MLRKQLHARAMVHSNNVAISNVKPPPCVKPCSSEESGQNHQITSAAFMHVHQPSIARFARPDGQRTELFQNSHNPILVSKYWIIDLPTKYVRGRFKIDASGEFSKRIATDPQRRRG